MQGIEPRTAPSKTARLWQTLLAIWLAVSFGLAPAAHPPALAATTRITLGAGLAALSGAAGSAADSFWGAGAWNSNDQVVEFYLYPALPPANLGAITVDDLASVSYRTKNGATASVDFAFYIYTAGTKYGWYEERLIAEPLYAHNYNAPADTWNTWSTAAGQNQLIFYDSHYGPWGAYTGPTLADLQAGPADWSAWIPGGGSTAIDYGSQQILAFKLGTGSGWAAGFAGNLDAVTISLTNGDVLEIDLEDLLTPVYVDDDWAAAPPGADPDGAGPAQMMGSDAFATVQQGVDAAAPGGTVHVAAGTYVEQVEIAKDLALQGAGPAAVIQSPDVLSLSFSSGSSLNKPVVYVHHADNVAIQNLTIDGAGKGNANYRFVGLGLNNAGGTVDGVTITGVRDTPFSGNQHGVALYLYNDDAAARTFTVTGSTFSGFQKNGIALNNNGAGQLTVNVQDNSVTGAGPTTVTAQNGIQVYGAQITGAVTGNRVTGIAYDNTSAATKWVATSLLNYYSDLQITDNVVTQGHLGIYNIDGPAEIARNQLTIAKIGVYAYGIVATDPPQAVPSPFDPPSARERAILLQPAATLPVQVHSNTVAFQGPDNTWTYGIEADAGYGPDDLDIEIFDNQVNGFGSGIVLWQCEGSCSTGQFTGLQVYENTLTGNTYGVETGPGPGVRADIRDNSVTGGDTALAAWKGETVFRGNTVNNAATVFAADPGLVTAYANNLTGFTTACSGAGCPDQGGTANLKHNWWGSYAVQGSVDAASWAARLGAPVVEWAAGDGSAALASAAVGGGSGAVALVSHAAVPPFIPGSAETMCSAYYDAFTVDSGAAAGLWSVALEVDSHPACDPVYAAKSVVYVPEIDVCAGDPAGCYTGYPSAQVSQVAPRTLRAANLAPAQLDGTPFVVASPDLLDPTVVKLNTFEALPAFQPQGLAAAWLVAALLVAGSAASLYHARRTRRN